MGKQVTNPKLFKSLTASSVSWNSDALSIRKLDSVGIQVNWSAGSSPVGTLKLQATVDGTNWVDLVTSTDLAVSGSSGSHLYNVTNIPFDQIRVVYTRTSGSADFAVYIMSKTLGH